MNRTCLKWILASAATGLFSAAAQAQNPIARVTSISNAGTGCPAGSVDLRFSSSHDALLIDFDDMVAESGPGVPASLRRKNCSLTIAVTQPQGWSFGIRSFEVDGDVELAGRAAAQIKAQFYFQGHSATATTQSTFSGPRSGPVHASSVLGSSQTVWSPCGGGRALNLNVDARVTGTGLIALDSPFNVGQALRIVWRRC